MQGIIGFRHYCLEFQQARPQNFVEVVMLFVRANVECKLIRWPITIERALIRVSICRSTWMLKCQRPFPVTVTDWRYTLERVMYFSV